MDVYRGLYKEMDPNQGFNHYKTNSNSKPNLTQLHTMHLVSHCGVMCGLV